MGSNWYRLLKHALYGHDTVNDDERDQRSPRWNPYGKDRKSPNEMSPTKTKMFDERHGLGDTRDFVEQYDEMKHESLLDQYDEGAVQKSPQLNGKPLDTVTDEPMSSGMSEYNYSPLGENQQTLRKAKEPNLDSKRNRLPGSNGTPPKPLLRNRRSSVLGPLDEAWAFQIKKGRGK